MKKIAIILTLFLVTGTCIFAQVGINNDGSTPHSSAMLDVKASDRGLLIPRISTTARDTIPSPATGLLIYNTTTNLFNYYNGSYWQQLAKTFITTTSGTRHPGGGVSINASSEASPDSSAMLDADNATRGILITRTIPELITNPATGLIIYNTGTNLLSFYNGSQWVSLCAVSTGIPGTGGSQPSIGMAIKTDNSGPNQSAILEVGATDKGVLIPRLSDVQRDSILPVTGLVIYNTTANGIEFFDGTGWYRLITDFLAAPGAATIVPSLTQIIWNWNAVSGASGYKWNTSNDYGSALDLSSATSTTETGLACNTPCTRYVWAYNSCGVSSPGSLTQTTLPCLACGSPITVNHVAGEVAPVNKTVTYGTVTNIPGEPFKCWITSNLGADHQATAVDDSTEASSGWYWQFNRKQGFKYEGTVRTPATTWITTNDENPDWEASKDPCSIELGPEWRIPTQTEWENVDIYGNWYNWLGPWNSGLKLHAAGYLSNISGLLTDRGIKGDHWSSSNGSSANVLFDNGPMINSSGTGAGGSDESMLQPPLEFFGNLFNQAQSYRLADDFSVVGNPWSVSSIEIYGYQTNSTTTSTFTAAYCRILNGIPGQPGTMVVWGDTTTNRLSGTSFTNIYRVAETGITTRPIMKIIMNTSNLVLPSGYYWIEFSALGSLPSGPWSPYVTINNTPETGNALQYGGSTNGYYPVTSGNTLQYTQGIPFKINGTQVATGCGKGLGFDNGYSGMGNYPKAGAFPIRCIKNSPDPLLPTVSTASITNISLTASSGGGNITSDGGALVTSRGVCWSTSVNPTIANDHTTDGIGTGSFTSSLTGLTPNTSYYVKAYATSSVGTSYGNQVNFTTSNIGCGQPFTDTRDGKVYSTVLIGTQCWMAQNLNVGIKINGSLTQSNNSTIEKYCYNDDEANCTTYGGLYQWDELMRSTGTLPSVLLMESFESGNGTTPPSGWTIEQVSGTTPGISFVTSSTYPTISAAFDGTKFVKYSSFNISTGSTRLKRTTAMSTIGRSPVTVDFAWYEDAGYSTSADRVDVQWSTNGTTWNTAATFNRYNALVGWKAKTVSLPSGASNQSVVYIAFLFTSAYGNNCSLDYVKVTGQVAVGICPAGWHVPDDPEWTVLTTFLGGVSVAGGKLKETGYSHWSSPNTGATNSSSFTALPGGSRLATGSFANLQTNANFWTATVSSTNAWRRNMQYSAGTVTRTADSKSIGYSLRCVREFPPVVSTSAVSNVLQLSATCGGNVTMDGGATVTARGVCWSTSTNPTISDNRTMDGSGTGVFVSNVTGLTANTTYFIRAYATNNAGTAYGNELSFTTQIPVLPTVTTAAVSNNSQSFASSGGNVTSDGAATVTAKGVCWSKFSNPTVAGNHSTDGGGTGAFASNLTGLTPDTIYFVRAYATNSAGTAYGNELTFWTLPAVHPCQGMESLTINHTTTGGVAPVNKTVTYGTVTHIPGEPFKCWITSNLGSDHQATMVNDSTEASAGWYWQFNRKQGYKHSGPTRTPNTTWITYINENFDWQAANDPCALELGSGWHIPAYSEWTNVDIGGNWTNWYGPWNSGLKIHAAGYLNGENGMPVGRGLYGYYWCSSQSGGSAYGYGKSFYFASGYSGTMNDLGKTFGISLRCLKDTCTTFSTTGVSVGVSVNPVCAGASVTFTATPVNGGTSPAYQWKVNGMNAGSNGPTYNYVPLNGDSVSCMMTSSTPCSVTPAFSNKVSMAVNPVPPAPSTGTHVAAQTQIVWNWNAVSGATGYKWNTSNNYSSALDLSSATSTTETGLTCNTACVRYVWAYDSCGYSTSTMLTQLTAPCPYICGTPITISHVAGAVAPVSKTVTYGTVTNIPGEITKCWITRNLGASQQATSVSDATEASAGWYWQFNRKQGYKHDGSTRTPNTTWIYISENSDWTAAYDPCVLELGNGWRIPTNTEWIDIDAGGGWTTWTGPWNSALKLHAAGYLFSEGNLYSRGSACFYQSTTQYDAINNYNLVISAGSSYSGYGGKMIGNSVRCTRDAGINAVTPTVTTTIVTNIVQTTATSGGNVTNDGGATVTAKGVCWSTTTNPTIAGNHTSDGTGTGIFVSNMIGLIPNTLYFLRAYATNRVETSYGDQLSFTTLPVSVCGASLTINHVAGVVAPVSKTVTYGIVSNIPGEPAKCWITSNLGADHQALAVDDTTEASAGWYWQFNRKQGFKHNGITLTPNAAWITVINENSDWTAANDPCTIELGTVWRIPTKTELTNVDASGNWTEYNGPWYSGLKLHAAGFLLESSGSLNNRGSQGFIRAGTQQSSTYGYSLFFYTTNCQITGMSKPVGIPLRCIRDY